MAQIEKDALTGTETTGHTWDGIKELNTPLPKWWLYTFYVCVIWAIGYMVFYPAWPIGQDYTKGVIGYSSRADHRAEMEMVKQSRSGWLSKFEAKDVGDVAKDSELLNYAMAGGKVIFNDNCAPCHGAGGQGQGIYPSLADDDWLWGGAIEDIYTSVQYGIRSAHEDTRLSDMPSFVADEMLTAEQVGPVADYVLALAKGAGSEAGKVLYEDEAGCNGCHGDDGKGLAEMGGPNLVDAIWLYGNGAKADIVAQISAPQHGVMPAWVGRLDDVSIKQVAVYVHALGGGQ